jgi:hypothetical protein
MPYLSGYDGPLHDRIHEALKALNLAQEVYAQSVRAIEGQYLRPLEASGEAAEQIAIVRAQFTESAALDMGHQSVRARFA